METAFSATNILTVTDLTEKLRNNLEKEFPFVWVQGEVTNLAKPGSGHLYFALKDRESQLQCVWFRHKHRTYAQNSFDPLTGEVFQEYRPSLADSICNGKEILCAGKIGIYAPKGQYQLVVEMAEYAGEGKLALELEEKKKQLAAKGYFSNEHKKKIPKNPQRVVLITSPHGAAIHDFLELANSRGYFSKIRLIPVAVQGDEAAGQIIEAIEVANSTDWAQVIVIVRGGGSLEDLWAFNDEKLVQAIYDSKIPIVSGIGHEIDVSITDLVADLRAATPSHAAQLLWSEKSELWQKIDDNERLLHIVYKKIIDKQDNYFSLHNKNLELFSPIKKISDKEQKLYAEFANLNSVMMNYLKYKGHTLQNILFQFNNYKYFINFGLLNEKIIDYESSLNIFINSLLDKKESEFIYIDEKINRIIKSIIDNFYFDINKIEDYLQILKTQVFLNNRCGLIYKDDMHISSISDLQIGDNIKVLFSDGSILAKINQIIKH